MLPKLAYAVSEVDANIGFKHRTIYIYNENSELHYHDNFYEIFLVLAPSIVHIINDSRKTLTRGTLVFVRKEDIHGFEYDASKEPSFVNLTFPESILKDLFSYLSDGYPSKELLSVSEPPSIVISETDIDWIFKQLEKLNSTMASDIPQLKYHCRVFLFRLFTRYFFRSATHGQIASENVPHWLYTLDKEMQKLKNFSQGIDHMVIMSGKSREYLGRMLKQYYGKTITEYINDLRLNYWANVLANSDMPILDICYECGFQNVSWAYTLFKKKYGISPLKYRKTS